jgi:hypothetical protein
MKNPPFTEAQYQELTFDNQCMDTPGMWIVFKDYFPEFDDRMNAFLWLVERWMKEGIIRFSHWKTNEVIQGDTKDLLAIYRASLPKSHIEADIAASMDDIGEGDGMEFCMFGIPPVIWGLQWSEFQPDGSRRFPDSPPAIQFSAT